MNKKRIACVVAAAAVLLGAADLGLIAYQGRVASQMAAAPFALADSAATWKTTFVDEGFWGRDYTGELALPEGLSLHFRGHVSFGLFPKATMTMAPETRKALEISGEDHTWIAFSPWGAFRTLTQEWRNLASGPLTLSEGRFELDVGDREATLRLGRMRLDFPYRPVEIGSQHYRLAAWREGDPYAGRLEAKLEDIGVSDGLKGALEVTTESTRREADKTEATQDGPVRYDVASNVRFTGSESDGQVALAWRMRLLHFRTKALDALQLAGAGDLSALFALQQAIVQDGSTVELDELTLQTPRGRIDAAGRLAYRPVKMIAD